MADRRTQQRTILALVLALGALVIPVSGALLYGGVASGSEFVFLGATSQYDFVPVLMLVGALGVLVMTTGGAGAVRSPLATATAATVAVAGGLLVLAYFGTAFSLRAGGPFGIGASGDFGWSTLRLINVATVSATGVMCGAVAVLAVTWLRERPTKELV